MTFNTSLVVALCLYGYGYKKYGWVEWVCLLCAVVAILLWYLTSNPLFALFLAIATDLFASTPTIVKTFKEPKSEIPIAWYLVTLAAVLGIVSTTIFDVANLAFPVYIALITALIGTMALVGRRIKTQK